MRHIATKVGALLATCGVVLGAAMSDRRAAAEAPASPVLVELFTSEGCSSCPPADTTLADLARRETPTRVVLLSFHVDYWNDLGWPDPFSSADYTDRQRAYANAFGSNRVYTPQAIVDGTAELVGSDRARAESEIAKAARRPHRMVSVVRARDRIDVRVSGATSQGSAHDGDTAVAWVAIVEDGLVVNVPRGENAGRTLHHDGVVRALLRLGPVAESGAHFEIAAPPELRGARRAVVLVQEERSRRVLGTGLL